MATIRDVAKRAGVSTATVSNVLNNRLPVSEALGKKVREAAAALDYRPDFTALSLKNRQTRTLGIVIPDITNPYFPLLVRGAEAASLKASYVLVTINTDDDIKREKNALSMLRDRKVDGVLLVAAPSDQSADHIQRLMDSGISVVCMDRVPKNAAVDAVLVDNVGGSRDCVSHLLDSGFKRIAMIGGPQTLETARQRLHGYKEGLRIGGMSLDRNLVVESNFRENGGFEAAIKLFRLKPRVDAIFVANGMMAIGVLHAMRKEGVRCPDDVGLVTFDDLPFSDAFQPSLTCIYQPAFEVGRLGTELLIERIEGLSVNGKPRVIQLSTELRVRESSVKRS